MESHPDQECRGSNNDKNVINTLDQNIIKVTTIYV